MAYQQRERDRKSVSVDDSKTKWADYSDEDEGIEEPEARESTFSSQPDENGVKIVTTYKTNENGEKVRITRQVKVTKKIVKINRNIASRRKWAKFGNCAGAPPGPEPNVTYVQNEPIKLDLKPRKRDDEVLPVLTPSEKPEKKKCRYCGGEGHMTLACPKRREILVAGTQPESRAFSRGGEGRGTTPGPGPSSSGVPGSKYVPVHLRSGGRGTRGSGVQMRDDSATIRVTNISEETNEDDLRELFRHYGRTNRIYLAKDRQSGRSRGFAFISYTTRQEAQKAIDALNDKGYDNLILHVEFAQPREDRDDKPAPTAAVPRDRQLGSQLAYDQVGQRGAKFDQYDERAF